MTSAQISLSFSEVENDPLPSLWFPIGVMNGLIPSASSRLLFLLSCCSVFSPSASCSDFSILWNLLVDPPFGIVFVQLLCQRLPVRATFSGSIFCG